MKDYFEKFVTCPHCGFTIDMTLDASNGSQEFYDDCPACYKAIHVNLQVDEQHDTVSLTADADDEQYF
jgi:translation initiation factor 2 beta subunit (eIF-2beta)/eIF-5